jgi:hypothetical protein
MDCCGHGHVEALQPWMWVSVGAMLAGEVGARGSTAAAQTAETTAAALAVIIAAYQSAELPRIP